MPSHLLTLLTCFPGQFLFFPYMAHKGLLVSLPTGKRVENFGAGVSNVSSLHVVISCFALRLKWA